MNEITRKYVVLRNKKNDHFLVGCIIQDRLHSDIFGENPQEDFGDAWYVHSAGYYTWVYQQPDTVRTHDESKGFEIGPAEIDVKLLRQYLDINVRSDEFDANGNPTQATV